MKKIKKVKKNKRFLVQIVFTALTNGYLLGFIQGKIYKGESKMICVPGLNCYSCPGAVGACPIGALQSTLAGANRSFPYYIVGTLILFGVTLGRIVCGFLCPFGLVQDVLYRIKIPKLRIKTSIDRVMRYVKYVILIMFVILFPMVLVNEFGIGTPTFCKWICPSGTLMGGIPLVMANESLQMAVGYLFNWKIMLLVFFIVVSMFVYRPFCKYICPLGAFYGLFNRFSLYRLEVDMSKCTNCKSCEKQCKMQVQITKNINSVECIRCGDCKVVCKEGCITSTMEKVLKSV
ncbi:MAG: 4Fe-4S binding protein [Eubacteriales bacterium]